MIGTKARNQKFTTPPLITTPPIAPVPGEIQADPNAPGFDLGAVLDGQPAPQMVRKGFLGRVDDWLHQPGTAAALFRSGAATLRDGLGAGLQAGAGYMDQQKAIERQQEQQDIENEIARGDAALRAQAEANRSALGWGGLGVDVGRLRETQRSNVAREGIDANGQRIQLYGIDTNAATTRRGQDVSLQANREDNDTTRRGQDLNYNASIYGNNLDYLSDAARTGMGGAGIGTRAYTQNQTKIPGKPGSGGFFGWGATDAVPEQIITTRVPMNGAPASSGGDPPQQAIEALKANPNLRGQFDAKYGSGKAAQYLGGR